MKPIEKGRFRGNCQKKVYDLTGELQPEVELLFKQQGKSALWSNVR